MLGVDLIGLDIRMAVLLTSSLLPISFRSDKVHARIDFPLRRGFGFGPAFKMDKSSLNVSEAVSEAELWATSRLRVRYFYDFEHSVGIEDHKRNLPECEFEALKDCVARIRLDLKRDSCINATLPLSQVSGFPDDLHTGCKAAGISAETDEVENPKSFNGEKKMSSIRLTSSKTIFLLCLVFRMVNSLLVQTYFNLDEHWQALEVAHQITFGYGHLTWEWKRGIHSYLHPMLFALLYKILAILHLDTPWFMVYLVSEVITSPRKYHLIQL